MYAGPDARDIPALMDELVADVSAPNGRDPFVLAAMAHLNLVMIHPFRDGNGRMARALQTLVLTHAGLSAPSMNNSETMTVGRCYIDVGQANPRHYHPDCDEVLHVLEGSIEHSADDETVRMGPGDTISIPQGVVHNATNVGDSQAVFVIAFSSADRTAVGESDQG